MMTQITAFSKDKISEYTGGFAPHARAAGQACIDAAIRIIIVAIFIVYIGPKYIGPWLGMDPAAVVQNYFLLGVIAGLISLPFAWLGSKSVTWAVRR